MKPSFDPSLRPVIPWMLADVLALADVILRLTKPYIVPETLIVPVAVALFFIAGTAYRIHRYQKEQKAVATVAATAAAEATAEATTEAATEEPSPSGEA